MLTIEAKQFNDLTANQQSAFRWQFQALAITSLMAAMANNDNSHALYPVMGEAIKPVADEAISKAHVMPFLPPNDEERIVVVRSLVDWATENYPDEYTSYVEDKLQTLAFVDTEAQSFADIFDVPGTDVIEESQREEEFYANYKREQLQSAT